MIKRVTDINSLSGVNSPLFPLIYADFKYSVSDSDGVFIQEVDGKKKLAFSLKGDSLTCVKLNDEYDSDELSSFGSFWNVSCITSDFEIQGFEMKKCVLMECTPENKSVSEIKELSSRSMLSDYEAIFRLVSEDNNGFDNWFPAFSRKVNGGDALGVYCTEDGLSVSTAIAPYIYDKTAIVAGVFTMTEYRSRGFATICVNTLINQCKNKKINKIYLWCDKDKIKFYNNLGFAICGEIYVKEE